MTMAEIKLTITNAVKAANTMKLGPDLDQLMQAIHYLRAQYYGWEIPR